MEMLSQDADEADPAHGGGDGQIIKASRVIHIADDRPVRNIGTERVQQSGANPLAVNSFPSTLASQPDDGQPYQENHLFCQV